ncbi:MAG TPA: ELWxxDGT repeat protein, partial [Bacteroidia bacterium]|nr:ELWxxDGT repeat protein [Bacteroidia bacterium]
IFPGIISSLNIPSLTSFNNFIYFNATSDGSNVGLWRSDGTDAGTTFVAPCNSAGGVSLGSGFASNASTLFFAANTASAGTELWKTDGTLAGTVMVKDIITGTDGAKPYNLMMIGDTLYFGVDNNTSVNGVTQDGLWKSDGTAGGTVNISKGYCDNPALLTNYRGSLIFAGYNDMKGTELWKINEPIGVGISQEENQISVNLFPNPSKGKFTFTSSRMLSEIKIYNSSGVIIHVEKIESKNNEINLIGQPKGIYFYLLTDDLQSVKTGKIIIE